MRFKSLPEPESEPTDESTDEFLMELDAARADDEIYQQEIQALGEDEATSREAQRIERALRHRVREQLGMEPWVDQSALSKDELAQLHGIGLRTSCQSHSGMAPTLTGISTTKSRRYSSRVKWTAS